LHQITGSLLIPLTLHHVRLHRFLPSHHALSSFFSYSFVSFSLAPSSPYRYVSTIAYGLLASLATYHALVGLRILWDPTAPRSLMPRRSDRKKGVTRGRGWQVGMVGIVGGVGLGVARIAGSGKGPEWIGKRYAGVLRQGWGF
jgi:succinate dehydrogenase/fumarate reductase cytochrome b subunit